MKKVYELRERIKTEDDQKKINGILNEIKELSIEINNTISEIDRLNKQDELSRGFSLERKKEIEDRLGIELDSPAKRAYPAIPITMQSIEINI